MKINVGFERRDNEKIIKHIIVRIDLADNEIISIDDRFQDRWAGNIKDLVSCDIEDTKDLDS